MNEVAIQTGGCNHSVTYNSLEEAKNILETNPNYARKYRALINALGAGEVNRKKFRKKNAVKPAKLINVRDNIQKFK